jgi:O-antigen/teichoic acid export membrane protein
MAANTLGSAVLWSAAQTVVRLVVGFLSIKVTAVYLGPTGIALTSQLNNVFSLLRSTAGNAVEDGVVTLTAKHASDDPAAKRQVLATATRWLLFVSAVVGLVSIVGSPLLAEHLLGDRAWAPLFVLLALVFPLALFGQLIVSVFSGMRRFDLVSLTQIGNTVLGAAIFVGLSVQWGLAGGLVGSLVVYAVILAVSGLLAWRTGALRPNDLFGPWNSEHAKVIFSYYPMLLAHGAAIPLSGLVVRTVMLDQLGTETTGLWQSAARLSDMYTMIIATALNMYSLPTLSAAKDDRELRREMLDLVVKIALAMTVITAVLYFLRHFIVRIVFTTGFEPVGDIWRFQLVADIFVLMCVPLRQALMVRRRAAAYILAEAVVAVCFVATAYALLPRVGVEGPMIAGAFAWAVCFVLLLWLNRNLLFGKSET